MVIALLAVLGVDLIVIVAFLGVVLSRRRWVSRQPGAFKGAVRVVEGEVPGLGAKWQRGSGRWVRDVLVWADFHRQQLLEQRLDLVTRQAQHPHPPPPSSTA